MYNNNKGNHS